MLHTRLVASGGIVVALKRLFGRVDGATPAFARVGEGFFMARPAAVENAERISLGAGVKLGPNSVLRAVTKYPGNWLKSPDGQHVSQTFEPSLTIGDRVTATANLQVVAYDSVVIEDDVLFAANVYISDGSHAAVRGDVPYKYQGLGRVAPVRVGRGSWIGQNVVITPGVEIGEFCVVGAGSVVTRSVPPACMAAGAPARVIKRWNPDSEAWEHA